MFRFGCVLYLHVISSCVVHRLVICVFVLYVVCLLSLVCFVWCFVFGLFVIALCLLIFV